MLNLTHNFKLKDRKQVEAEVRAVHHLFFRIAKTTLLEVNLSYLTENTWVRLEHNNLEGEYR